MVFTLLGIFFLLFYHHLNPIHASRTSFKICCLEYLSENSQQNAGSIWCCHDTLFLWDGYGLEGE